MHLEGVLAPGSDDLARGIDGQAAKLRGLCSPEGSEVPGLSEETDQMVVSVNAPKAVEEEPVLEEGLEDGETPEGEEGSEEAGGDDSAPTESEEDKEDNSES